MITSYDQLCTNKSAHIIDLLHPMAVTQTGRSDRNDINMFYHHQI